MTLGAEGKLWAVEILFELNGETKADRYRNLTGEKLQAKREEIFKYGLLRPIGPGHWEVVPPRDILKVSIYKQNGYFSG